MELNRFDKSLDDCVDLADKWFYSLKHMGSMDGPDIRTDRASGGRYQEKVNSVLKVVYGVGWMLHSVSWRRWQKFRGEFANCGQKIILEFA